MNLEDLEHLSTSEILNEIGNYHGCSLLERMMDFCETNDVEPQYLGDILADDDKLKLMLHNDCVMSNSIKDYDIQHRNDVMEEMNEW